MGVHPKTSILALIGDMGWPTSQIKRHRNMIWYWNILIYMNDNRLTKQLLYMIFLNVKVNGVVR